MVFLFLRSSLLQDCPESLLVVLLHLTLIDYIRYKQTSTKTGVMVPRSILLSLLSWCVFCQKLDRDSIFTSNSTEKPSPAVAGLRYPVCYELVNYVTFVVDENGIGDRKKIADPLKDLCVTSTVL